MSRVPSGVLSGSPVIRFRNGRRLLGPGAPYRRRVRAEIAAGPLDAAAAHSDLAESYMAAGDKVLAKKEVLAAMEIAPGYPRAQNLLLKLVQ